MLYKTYNTFHLQSSAPPNQETPRELKPQPWARAMGQRHKQGLPRGEPGTHLSHVETYRCAPKHCPFLLPTRDGASLHRQRATAEVLLTQRPSKCYAFNFKADQKNLTLFREMTELVFQPGPEQEKQAPVRNSGPHARFHAGLGAAEWSSDLHH